MKSRALLAVCFATAVFDVAGCGGPTGPTDRDGGPVDATVNDAGTDAAAPSCGTCGATQACCAARGMCVDVDTTALCDLGVTCDPTSITVDGACVPHCGTCNDTRGILATYLDVTAEGTGFAVSGYSSGPASGPPLGDLVVGHAASLTAPIHWELVDGAPTGTGWRGGSTAPGDDIGRWSSIVSLGGDLWVASYDATHGALRVAHHTATGWTSHTVDDTGDAGRYASMTVSATGRLAIAYATVVRGNGAMASSVLSRVMVARANVAAPSGTTDWTVDIVRETTIPCLPSDCTGVEQCLTSGGCEVPTFGCTPACGTGTACSAGACVALVPADTVVADYPLEGGWTRLAATAHGLALLWHDGASTEEVLRGAAFDGTAWGTPFAIEGRSLDPSFGDSGSGADLFVDSLDRWHVSFVDRTRRRVRYARVEAGAVAYRTTIDDGANDLMGVAYPEGAHRVGGSTAIAVAMNHIYIAYQDESAHQLRVARLTDGAATPATIVGSDTMGFAGFWAGIVATADGAVVSNQWRANATLDQGGVRLLEVH